MVLGLCIFWMIQNSTLVSRKQKKIQALFIADGPMVSKYIVDKVKKRKEKSTADLAIFFDRGSKLIIEMVRYSFPDKNQKMTGRLRECLQEVFFFPLAIQEKYFHIFSFYIISKKLLLMNSMATEINEPEEGISLCPRETKMEECLPLRAHYISVKLSRRPLKPLKIFMRTERAGSYVECQDKKNDEEEFNQRYRRETIRRRKNSSDDEYSVKSQKKDRNVTSNLIHHLMKYLISFEDLNAVVSRIIAARNLNITLERFHKQLAFENKNLKTYVTLKHMKELWFSENESKREICIIMRTLSKYFLCNHGFLSVYFSNKFNKVSKQVHYKGLRSLILILSKRDFEQIRIIDAC